MPGLGIDMVIASSHVDGTVPSLEILLNKSNRNFWELSDKSRYHLVWDIVTQGQFLQQSCKAESILRKNGKVYESSAAVLPKNNIGCSCSARRVENWAVYDAPDISSHLQHLFGLGGFCHLFSEQVVKWMCSFQQSCALFPIPILSGS